MEMDSTQERPQQSAIHRLDQAVHQYFIAALSSSTLKNYWEKVPTIL